MKKIFALLTVCALLFTLAACGAGKPAPAAPETDGTTAQATQNEETEGETEAEAEQLDDGTKVEEQKQILLGTWGFPGDGSTEDMERLTFNADGTGSYYSFNSKDLTFTYEIHIDHRTYANGAPYEETMLKMAYNNGETEDIIYFFTESGKLAFHNGDNGGYFGVMDNIDCLVKE